MASKVMLDIAAKFNVTNLENVKARLDTLMQTMDFGKHGNINAKTIGLKLQTAIDNAYKMIEAGEIDVKKLGLDKIATQFESFMRSVANTAGRMPLDALKPFQEEYSRLEAERIKKIEERKQLEKQASDLNINNIKAELRAKTGESRISGMGNLKQAEATVATMEEDHDPTKKAEVDKLNAYKDALEKIRNIENDRAQIDKKINKNKKQTTTIINKQKISQESLTAEMEKFKNSADAGQQELFKLYEQLKASGKSATEIAEALNEAQAKQTLAAGNLNNANNKGADGLIKKASAALSLFVVINQLRRLYRQAIKTVTELDKAMTDTAIVTDMSRQEAWKLIGTYQTLAGQTGLRVTELSGVVNQFLRQGRTLKDALELTRVAAQSAKVAGISASEAVDFLTAAVNGFGLAADQAESIADKFASVASQSASSFKELALAMSKVAPTAQSAGIGIDFMMGVLAKGIETTREAPENIGTAFKTIFARMREVTDLGKAMEDGMDLNRVEKALLSVDVPLRDLTGQFRSLETVLMDVGEKWDTLTSVEQAYLATALAGSRQQPRLLAIFNDFARTKELIQASADSTGDLAFQHFAYMTGMEASMTNLNNSFERFITTLTDSEIVIGIIQQISRIVDYLSTVLSGLADASSITTTALIILGTILIVKSAKMIIATVNNVVYAISLLNVAAAAKAAGVTVGAFVAILAIKVILIAAVVAAIGFFVFMLIKAANSSDQAGKGASYFGDKIRELNSHLNDLEKKTTAVDKLIERFNVLNNITSKSVDQVRELASLSDDLRNVNFTPKFGELAGKEQNFNLITTDFAGNEILDMNEYRRLMNMIEADKKESERLRKAALDEGIRTLGSRAFEDRAILDTAKKVGYDAGLAYLEGIKQATNDAKNKTAEAIERALSIIDPSKFVKQGHTYSFADNLNRYDLGAFETQDEAIAAATALGLHIDTLAKSYDPITFFDEKAFEAFTENLSRIYLDFYSDIEDAINDLDADATILEKTESVLDARIEAYEKAMLEANKIADPEEKKLAVRAVGASLVDEKILFELLENDQISKDLIVNLLIQGLDSQGINKLLTQFLPDELMIRELKKQFGAVFQYIDPKDYEKAFRMIANRPDVDKLSQDIMDSILIATGGDFEIGFQNFKDALEAADYTEEEVEKELVKLSNLIQTITAEAAGRSIRNQMKTSSDVFSIATEIAKGNFERFTDLAQLFGAQAIEALMGGDEGAVIGFIRESIDKEREKIQESIDKLRALRTTTGTLSVADAAELATLETMDSYYQSIAEQTAVRNYRLGQTKALTETINSLLGIQNSLIEMGLGSSSFVKFLQDINSEFEEMASATLGRQLTDDLTILKTFGVAVTDVNGNIRYMFDPDNMNSAQFRAAIENYTGTLTEFISLQQRAFNQYKKTVTETYGLEIDAIRNSVAEKYQQIDYANKLAEAEEKVLMGRRNLAALQISGSGRSALRQAETELKKLEQERRRIIEERMAEEAQKLIEQQRDDLILAAQQAMVDEIEKYTNGVELAVGAFRALTDVYTGGGVGGSGMMGQMVTANDLTLEQNTLLKENNQYIQENTEQLKIFNESKNTRTTFARGSAFVDTSLLGL
jgi:TP901 family phage tail tape measure protein